MTPLLPPGLAVSERERLNPLLAALAAAGLPVARCELLAGDVGARRYFRLYLSSPADADAEGDVGAESAVAALYPPGRESDCQRFFATGRLLAAAGVPVPAVRLARCDGGWMVVEDAGPRTLAEVAAAAGAADWGALGGWYGQAVELAERISSLSPGEVSALGNPPLDAALLRRELAQTADSFLAPVGLATGEDGGRLGGIFDDLCGALGQAPALPCHRDFMVRNLVPRAPRTGSPEEPGASLVVLDHQDLRLGPRFYDLASLLNDTLFPPPELVAALLAPRLDAAGARLAWQRAVAQRCLKAVGTFTRHRMHLHLIAPTWRRALEHLEPLPETRRRGGVGAAWWSAAARWDDVLC